MEKRVDTEKLSLEKIYTTNLPVVSRSIGKAVKSIEAGNKEDALAELQKAEKMLAEIKEAIGKLTTPEFANARCPIMNLPIDPDKVTSNLIRNYKGERVAFCCGMCPVQWDALTDAEKDTRLAKVKPRNY
jgi:hypothetical protein